MNPCQLSVSAYRFPVNFSENLFSGAYPLISAAFIGIQTGWLATSENQFPQQKQASPQGENLQIPVGNASPLGEQSPCVVAMLRPRANDSLGLLAMLRPRANGSPDLWQSFAHRRTVPKALGLFFAHGRNNEC